MGQSSRVATGCHKSSPGGGVSRALARVADGGHVAGRRFRRASGAGPSGKGCGRGPSRRTSGLEGCNPWGWGEGGTQV